MHFPYMNYRDESINIDGMEYDEIRGHSSGVGEHVL